MAKLGTMEDILCGRECVDVAEPPVWLSKCLQIVNDECLRFVISPGKHVSYFSFVSTIHLYNLLRFHFCGTVGEFV